MESEITDLCVDRPDATETLAISGVHIGGLVPVEIFAPKDLLGKIDMTNTLNSPRVWEAKDFGDWVVVLVCLFIKSDKSIQ